MTNGGTLTAGKVTAACFGDKMYGFLDEDTRFIDLFAGIGGFHLAMKSVANAQCVLASEIDKYAKQTYETNWGDGVVGDITKIPASDIPEHDVLCGGFPCQAFSISGLQRGFADTRGTLFNEIVRIAQYRQPKMMFLENVWNLERHDHGRTFAVIKAALEGAGYDVFHQVLDASDYGVPQPRRRIYILCFRKDLHVSGFRFPEPTHEDVALEDVLEDAGSANLAKYVIHRSDVHIDFPENVGDAVPRATHLIRIGHVNKGGQGERIYSQRGTSVTLSAYGGGIGGKTGLYMVDGVIRKLSPRECLRIQGFPDDFVMPVSDAQAWKQTGNSVAVPVLRLILEEVNRQVPATA